MGRMDRETGAYDQTAFRETTFAARDKYEGGRTAAAAVRRGPPAPG
jgi:hypothetical protein